MNNIHHFLKLLNLSESEITVFELLLKKKEATILEIAKETEIERTRVYRIVDGMIAKDLVFERLEYKKKYFRPCNISILKEKAELEINRGNELANTLDNTLNSIEKIANDSLTTSVKYYHGVSGIKQIFWNQLKARKVIYAYSYKDLVGILGTKFFTEWKYEFEKRKLKAYDLRSEEFVKSTKKYKPIPLKGDFKRYIRPELLNIITEVDIYNDTVVIADWDNDEKNIYAIEIENKKFAQMQKQIFKTFWEMGEKYKRSKDAAK